MKVNNNKVLTLNFMLYLFKSENTFTSVIQRKKNLVLS